MNKTIGISLIVSLILGGATYIATNNIFLSIGILIISLGYAFLFVNKRISKFEKKINRFHETYHFINNFIISLSIKKSLVAAFENVYNGSSDELKDQIDSIRHLKENEKLKYLNKYFFFNSYEMFTDLISLWNEEGGDVLSMTNYLLNQLRLEEEYITFSEINNKKVLIEFSILWAIVIGILCILRFALADFYFLIAEQFFFQVAVSIFMIFILTSAECLLRKITNIELKEIKNEK